MRVKILLPMLLLVLTTACQSRYSDGWQPDPTETPQAPRDPQSKPEAGVEPKTEQPKPEPKAEPRPEPKVEARPQPQDILNALNDQFRQAYVAAREEALKNETYALVLGDSVVFYRGAIRREAQYTPARYHELKAIAHIPLALYALLNGPLSDATLTTLGKYRDSMRESRATLARRGFDERTLKRQEAIFTNSQTLLDRVLNSRKCEPSDLQAFTTAMAPLLLQNAYDAAKAQLEGLHAVFMEWLNVLTAEERANFHIVVSGSHQARERNLHMTYCRALLGEIGPAELRLIFGESCFDEPSCRNLLGTHLLDGAASLAFFDDPLRLQYDLLGDAAAEIVPRLKMAK